MTSISEGTGIPAATARTPRITLAGGDPASAAAAVATVIHRRTLQEQVQVTVYGPHGPRLFEADLAGDPPFGALRDQAARVLGFPAEPDSPLELGWEGPPGDQAEIAEQANEALRDGAAHPGRPASALSLASPAARRLVQGWNGAAVAPAAARPVHVLVTEQARRRPNATAISSSGDTVSYRQLDQWASQLAARLTAAGARPGQIIAVLAERSPGLIAGLLAVLKTGAAYAAFEPDMPRDRLARQLADTDATLALAMPKLADQLPAHIRPIPLAATAGPRDLDGPAEAGCDVHPGALAYVSFTSGSTGTPKGVCVPHQAVSRLVREPDWAAFDERDVFLQISPVAFDASTLEIWGALANGARLAVHPPGPVSTSQLAATLVGEQVTVAWLTSGLFDRMVREQVESFAGLRHVLAGGDVVSADRVRQLLGTHPGLVFSNGYGPTENTTFTAVWTSARPPAGSAVPLGRPISGTRVRVLDPRLRPVPPGVPGELYAGGDGLARCYLARPGATAERFVPDPGAGYPGARLYRTGDLVRWRPDGTLDFLGRTDRQVKIQGYRVEPSEIEAVLIRRPEVRQAAVIVQSEAGRGSRLLAYIAVSGDETAGLGSRLREELRDELPAYMVPAAIVVLPELPLNRNGKVDRAALPAAVRTPRSLPGECVSPRTPLESAVAQEWGDLLGIEPIGIDDDFFELGGHSLIAAELLTRLQERFGVTISARTLYLHPTVSELAGTIPALDQPAADR